MESPKNVLYVYLIALSVMTFAGCSSDDGEVVVPNKPPLSAEAAKEKSQKHQQERIKSLQDQAKRHSKK